MKAMESKRHPHGGRRVPGPGKKNGRPLKAAHKRERYSLTLDPALMALLDVQAKEQDISRSDAVNAAVAAWLMADGKNIEEKSLLTSIPDQNEEGPPDAETADLIAEMDSLEQAAAELFNRPVPSPPAAPDRFYERLHEAVQNLYMLKWPKRPSPDLLKSWKKAILAEPELRQALKVLTFQLPKLNDLIRKGRLGITPTDIRATAELDVPDRRVVLMLLAKTGMIDPDELGEVAERYLAAKARQPWRNGVTLQLEELPPLLFPPDNVQSKEGSHAENL